MPELPEVESLRNLVESLLKGCTIDKIVFHEQGGGPRNDLIDDLVLETPRDQLEYAFLRRELIAVSRKGKYLWFTMAPTHTVLFHFGMTGSFVIQGEKSLNYKSFSVSESWPPKFTKLELVFSNGKNLAFIDPRRLGRIKVLAQHPSECEPVKSLATDPFLEVLRPEVMREQLSRYSAPIKTILLNQNKVCCGIGNYVADEVLFQSHIHPQTPADALTEPMVQRLSEAITEVVHIAVQAQADSQEFPKDWIFHHRWDKSSRDPHGHRILLSSTGAIPTPMQYVCYCMVTYY